MLDALHLSLMLAYAVLPPGLLAWAIISRNHRRRTGRIAALVMTIIAGVSGGACFMLLNNRLMDGHAPTQEWVKLIYFAIGALCVLKILDRLMLAGMFRLMRIRTDAWGRPASPRGLRVIGTLFVQRVAMFAVTIAYLAGLMMIYRPRIIVDQPKALAEIRHSDARFTASDGVELAGWWIPAARQPRTVDAEAGQRWGKRTVLLCHGIASGKESQVPLARFLRSRGFNVLVFDFRGHGESEGNLITYGRRERLDVLAAVSWIKKHHAAGAERIYGIGMNVGAAALLAAAVDGEAGRSIDAVVLMEPYARFGALAHAAGAQIMPAWLRPVVVDAGLPIASLHAGVNLAGFEPAKLAELLWPRPALVIHSQGLSFVPSVQGMELYQMLMQPKEQFWPEGNYELSRKRIRRAGSDAALLAELFRQWVGSAASVSDNAGVRERTARFLDEAEEVPAL